MLIFCAIFDLLRTIFVYLWFFGPLLMGVFCASTVTGKVGTFIGETLCGSLSLAVGVAASPALIAFGAFMAMVIGFAGWLAVGLILLFSNRRIYSENAMSLLWSLLGLGASELPFINALPVLTLTVGKLYHTQIKKEKRRFAAWEKNEIERVSVEYDEQRALFAARRAEAEETRRQEEIPAEDRLVA